MRFRLTDLFLLTTLMALLLAAHNLAIAYKSPLARQGITICVLCTSITLTLVILGINHFLLRLFEQDAAPFATLLVPRSHQWVFLFVLVGFVWLSAWFVSNNLVSASPYVGCATATLAFSFLLFTPNRVFLSDKGLFYFSNLHSWEKVHPLRNADGTLVRLRLGNSLLGPRIEVPAELRERIEALLEKSRRLTS